MNHATGKALARTFGDLSLEEADKIVTALEPYVSEARRTRIAEALATRTRDVTIVLEDVSSEHNASAVLRTAEALGVLEVHIVPRGSPFKLSRKVSLGTHKWLDLVRHESAADAYGKLKARGFSVWASDVHGEAVTLDELPNEGPIALVFGNEHAGLTREAVEAADGRFRIPMTGFVESLNISVAAAITTYTVLSRRRAASTVRGLAPDDMRRLRATWYALSVRAAPQILGRAGIELPRMAREEAEFADEG